ncbi:MAG TPA: YciI family protein [Anaerolineales bacterium]|nr:YciI family protein [Anaerolineales bacterium]HLO30144.1 YciI family protein [Anaerolineales bacterium]
MSDLIPRPVRYVVFHKPGSKWQYGVDFREQAGVGDHVGHYLKLHEQGKLELGGPFLLQDAGGMMVATKDVSQEELEAFAAADPAVQAGLLIYEIRPRLTAMEHT